MNTGSIRGRFATAPTLIGQETTGGGPRDHSAIPIPPLGPLPINVQLGTDTQTAPVERIDRNAGEGGPTLADRLGLTLPSLGLDAVRKRVVDAQRTATTVAIVGAGVVGAALLVSFYFAARSAKERADAGERFVDGAMRARFGMGLDGRAELADDAHPQLPRGSRDASRECACEQCAATLH